MNGMWYIFGILVLVGLISHSCYLCFKSTADLWRLRIIIKGILLSMTYVNPVYLFYLVFISETTFLVI